MTKSLSITAGSGGTAVRALLDRDVRRLRRETAPWVRGWSLLLVAGRRSLEGRLEEAVATLKKAERELERADLLAYRAACRWRRPVQSYWPASRPC